MALSSIIVQTKKEHIENVISSLKNSGLCEYHMNDEKGKIIITVEGKGVEEEISKLQKIQKIENVISAEMVYSYDEDELDKLRENIDDKIPEWMNSDIDAKNIIYQGDLKKKY
ncbi:MAG: chaperone NapD [Bacteroidales bacterium]|nr:chaperone NapD [Bacteroidales bacterium]